MIGPPESWVLPAAVPPAPAAAEGASTVDLLSDAQVRFSADGDSTYRAVIYRIATPQGLEDGALQISWDPDLQSVTLHHYRLLRDGKTIDLLGDGSKLIVVRRETNLERAALDGELTATLQPEDVRVGDVIDLAYTRTRRDPAMAGKSEILIGPNDGVPFGRNRVRILWPASKKITWRAFPGVIQPRAGRVGADNELVSDLSNVTTPRPPRGAPSRFKVVNAVEATEFADWPSVSRVFAPFYLKAGTLPPQSPLRAEAARIAQSSSDPKVRAELALALVQQQVRYLFLGMDDGGYVPADADLTWSRRFGDCKAKTVLLVALLKELGIDARPVLVHTTDGDFLATRLPMMGSFDHAIVEARIGGRSYWLDGTRLGDRKLDRLRTPNYKVGLPIVAQGAALEPLTPEPLTQPTETTSLTLDASAGIDVPAPAKAEMRFRGDSAVDMRLKYSELSATDRDVALRKLWRETYDFVVPQAVAISDDAESGDFLLTMVGTARMAWDEEVGTRWYEADRARLGWKFDDTREDTLNRDAPFAFDYPDWWQSKETIMLPYKGAGFRLQGDDVDKTIGGLYAFHRKIGIQDGVMTMEADTRALAAELPAAQAAQTRLQMAELARTGVYVRLPNDYLATDADMAALKDDKAASAQAYLHRGAIHFDRGELDASIADEDAAIALKPDQALAHSVRAMALAAKGDMRGEAAADKALALDPKQGLAWRSKGVLALQSGRFADADHDFTQDLALNENDEHGLVGRGTARVQLGRFADGLADIDAALAIAPKIPIRAVRAQALLGLGRKDEASAEADRAVAAQPNDANVRQLRVGLRSMVGLNAEAIADLDVLIAAKPQAEYYASRAMLWPAADRARRTADIGAALRLDPANLLALSMRANDEIEAGALDQAEADIAAADKVDRNGRATEGLHSALLVKRGRLREALELANRIVAKHPEDAMAFNNRCWLKATLNLSADTALADCEAALKLAPGSPAILDSRAFAKLRMGTLDGAIEDYNAVLKIAPNLPASLYGRGLARARKGDREGALSDIAAARKLSPAIDARFATFGMNPPDAPAAPHP